MDLGFCLEEAKNEADFSRLRKIFGVELRKFRYFSKYG